MRNLIIYSLQDYLRSHKYFPPVLTYIIFIIIFYTYTPNPIIDSYAITGIALYIISSWLCISLLSLDSPVQRQLMILHLKSIYRYYISKLISVWFISLALTVFAFIYPIVFNMFNDSVTVTNGSISLINHVILATLGICVGSLFSMELVKTPVNSFGGLLLTLVISIASLGIYEVLPSALKHVVWIIPPVTYTHLSLFNWSGEKLGELSFFPFVWVLIFSFIILLLFLTMAKRVR